MRTTVRFFCVFMLIFLMSPLGPARGDLAASSLYQKISGEISGLRSSGECFQLKNVHFERDSGVFVLQEGRLYPLTPINGKKQAAVFVGKGAFRLHPPLPIERNEIKRLYGQPVFEQNFRAMFLLFNDSTLARLSARGTPAEARPAKDKPDRIVSDALEYLIHYDDRIEPDVLKVFLDREENSFFYAHFFEDDRYEPYFFVISPYRNEAVSFLRWAESSSHLFRRRAEISRFPAASAAGNHGPFMRVLRYEIDTDLPFHSFLSDQLDYNGVTDIQAVMLRPAQRWLYFYLDTKITVDSVLNAEGQKLDFVKGEKFYYVFVDAGKTLDRGDTLNLRFHYHSRQFLERTVYGWIVMKDESDWYPRYGNRQKAHYRFTYRYPSKFELVSVGDPVSKTENQDMITSQLITPAPIANASFNIGLFKKTEIREPGLPRLVVLKTEKYGVVERRNTEEEILDDGINCLRFFNHLLGAPPINTLYISESPYGHGLAYPGLIHLSMLTYVTYSRSGFDELFRAHETAHQWWGIGVDYRTYRDKWLSEGFSEFFGLWYMQKALKNTAAYFKVLRDWKENLFDDPDMPPVYLGSRIGNSITPTDYERVVYTKGAWILHMLRSMLIDLQTMDESIFVSIMRDFYNTYTGKKASTEDFKTIIERHTKQNMDWFFNQWVYGSEMPQIEYAVKPVKWGDNGYKVQFAARVKEVSDGFVMPVIIEITLENGYKARTSRWIRAPFSAFSIQLPMEPDEIRFNAFESVLAETEEVDWDSFEELLESLK